MKLETSWGGEFCRDLCLFLLRMNFLFSWWSCEREGGKIPLFSVVILEDLDMQVQHHNSPIVKNVCCHNILHSYICMHMGLVNKQHTHTNACTHSSKHACTGTLPVRCLQDKHPPTTNVSD